MREALRRMWSVVTRRAIEDGLAEEIRFHIDQQAEKNIRAGMLPSEARRRALIKFGGVEHVKEQTRDEFRPALFEDFLRDLRYGARVLRRAPGFALVAIVTLGVGIGAATAVFSVVNGVLLAPLPYPEPDRIVRLFQIDDTGRRMGTVSEPNFEDWKNGTRAFRAMAETSSGPAPVTIGSETSMLSGSSVSREFFNVMGVRPALGRAFREDELSVGAGPTVVISDRLWRTRMAGAPLETVTLRANDVSYQVVGVMPAGFDYPSGSEYWFPRELTAAQTSRTAHNFVVIARLADGVTLDTAIAELSGLSRALKQEHGDETWMSDATAVALREQLTATTRPMLLMLFGAAVVLLVIACLNVSNMQLARAATRRRELAVRLAIGAGRGRITRQLLAESIVLSAAATLAGVAIAFGGVRTLVAMQPANLPRVQDVTVDLAAMLFAVTAAGVTAAALGLATALRVSRQDVRDALSEGTRSMAGGRTSERVRQTLVVAQVALTIILLAGAGLLARSFVNVMAVDPGFRTDKALLAETQWAFSREPALQQRRKTVQQELLDRLRNLPGVEAVGLVNAHPLGGGGFANGRFLEMTRPDELQSFDDVARLGPEAKSRAGFAGYRIASEEYFAAMGIRLIRGRLFDERDGSDAPHVAVISESLASTKWPGQDPLGRFVQFGNMDGDLRGFRIVGVVSDVREMSPESVPEPLFYGFYQQRMASRFTVVVRSEMTSGLAATVRQVVREADPELPLQLRTMEDAFDRALAGRRFSLMLIVAFSASALLLATLGIYGLITYLVAERTREIGIRLALGAESADVLRLVLGKGIVLAVAGIIVGLAAAMGLTRFLEGMLFGVTTTDPLALGAVMVVTLLAVVSASFVPARRAMRVAPVIAMRAE
ncbi:MAG TPA: ABC transporter permease [Vicinamibacterales bacterium]|nr:ABC transporter permease [Vicinamibacterales bacterium]